MKSFFIAISLLLGLTLQGFTQIPSGYYTSATGLTGTSLQSELHSIIDNHSNKSYSSLWGYYSTTDKKANGFVWDMYSDVPNGTTPYDYTFGTEQCGTYSVEGDCYNREHSFPKSWFNDVSPMNTDLFHVYPTDGKVNGYRNNWPYGEVTTATWTSLNGSKVGPNTFAGSNGGTCFEPIDDYKGDFARTYFYMATRYYGEDGSWNSNDMVNGAEPTTWAMQMLMAWHLADPVSTKETERNDDVYGIQNNRNPFIDHPEYAAQIWGGASPSVKPEPTNHVSDFGNHYIDLEWTDAVNGQLPEGYLVVYSTVSYQDITTPVDGNDPSTYSANSVAYGIESIRISKLPSATTFYIQLIPYTGSGASTKYKTDGSIPQLQKSTP